MTRSLNRSIPYIPSPPSMPPTVDCIAPSTLRAASFTAASTRSWSISTSPDVTASGSMRRLSSCLRPSIFAVTVPPPDEASTTVSCIFFCRVSYCALAFDISSCRLNPPIKCLTASPCNQSPYEFPRRTSLAAGGRRHPAPRGHGRRSPSSLLWIWPHCRYSLLPALPPSLQEQFSASLPVPDCRWPKRLPGVSHPGPATCQPQSAIQTP